MSSTETPRSHHTQDEVILNPAVDSWMAYLRWNRALADVVYGPASSGVPAYLDLEDEVLERAASITGEPTEDLRHRLVAVVRPTLNRPDDRAGMFGGHISRLQRWQVSAGEPPPVIALLALLSLAAENMRQSDGFAANNYYDRLMPLLGITTEADKKRVIRAYRKSSFDLWESLNGWLEDMHGERGLPTAYAYAHAHVGRPLSQALIRATDREKLGELFFELGLEPRSRLSPQDMESLLADWISRDPSPASKQMWAMWQRSGARERITDIACQLLETWEPPTGARRGTREGGATSIRGRQLLLLALIRTFPTSALELNVVGPELEGEPVARLLDPRTGAPLDADLGLEALPGRRWRLARVDQLETSSLLEGILQLGHSSGVVLERRPRRVIPFRKDQLLQAFVEVERLGLGEDGMVACKEGLGRLLNDALGQVARPGFRRMVGLPGLPNGWVLFDDVQVLVPLTATTPRMGGAWPVDLNVLQPLATSQLVLSGGLQLPGRVRRWSSLAPPEIRAAAENALGISILVDRIGTFERPVMELERKFNGPVALLDLRDVHLRDADYEITATEVALGATKPHTLNVVRMRLRSGSNPNPSPPAQPPLARPLNPAGLGAIRAVAWRGDSVAVRGAAVVGGVSEHPPKLVAAFVGTPPWWERRRGAVFGSNMPDQHGVVERRVALPATEPNDCFRTGAHVLRLPPFYGKTTKSTVEGVCRHCGLVKRFPARYRPMRRPSPKTVRQIPKPAFDVSGVAAIVSEDGVNADAALDALSHDRAGPESWFEQLALQVEPSQLFVDRLLRALEVLGHIEVSRDERTFRATGWEVLAPTFVELADGSFAVTGHRCHKLLDAAAERAEHVGARIERTAQGPAAPDRIRLVGASLEGIGVVAVWVGEHIGLPVGVEPRAARNLARVLPPLTKVVQSLRRQPMLGAHSIKRWDVGVARWQVVGDASVPGAYQFLGATTAYCLRDEIDVVQGTMRRADARLVKYAAALEAGEPMIGYDASREVLYVPLGAELPGLYGRAVVLSSGLVPTDDEGQHLVRYPNVPTEIAQHVSAMLGS